MVAFMHVYWALFFGVAAYCLVMFAVYAVLFKVLWKLNRKDPK